MTVLARFGVLLSVLFALPACAAELTLEGHATQGGLMIGRTAPGAEVTLDGKPLRVAPDGRFVFGFGREYGKEAELVVRAGGKVERKTIDVAARSFEIQHIDGLPEKMVSPPPKVLARIKREAAAVAKAREIDSDGTWFEKPFIQPADGPVSGVFGSQRILNGEPRAPHSGVDFAAPEGTPVREVAGGRVTLADDLYFTGNTVIVDHGYGLSSVYCHMKTVKVKLGDVVAQGDEIGTVGATGRATGPHLHWGVSWFDVRLDPQLLLPAKGP